MEAIITFLEDYRDYNSLFGEALKQYYSSPEIEVHEIILELIKELSIENFNLRISLLHS